MNKTVTKSLCLCMAAAGILSSRASLAQIKVACVGDSITWGQGASNTPVTDYEGVLQSLLGSGYTVSNYGVPGETMISNPNLGGLAYVTTSAYRASLAANPNIVIIQLGTNDAITNCWGPDGGEFTQDAQNLVNTYAALPTHPKIYLCLPPPLSTQDARAANLENGVIPDLRNVTGVTLIDNYTPLRNQPWNFWDGIHPKDPGYAIIGTNIYHVMTNTPPALPRYVAVGPDNNTRILSLLDRNGTIDLKTIAADGVTVVSDYQYGPFPGWTAAAICVGPDNSPHILWNYVNNAIILWKLSPDGSSWSFSPVYGAATYLKARDISVGPDNLPHVLWDDTNNNVVLWRLAADGTNPVVSPTYSSTTDSIGATADTNGSPGWADKALAVGPDNLPHILFGSSQNSVQLWRTNSDGSSPLYGPQYGPYNGYNAVDMGIGPGNKPEVLWNHGTDFMTMFAFNSDGSYYSYFVTYWQPVPWLQSFVDVGGDNRPHILVDNADGSTSLNILSAP